MDLAEGANWNLDMLVFDKSGKPEIPKRKLSEQHFTAKANNQRNPYMTRIQESNLDHTGVLSPLETSSKISITTILRTAPQKPL